MSTLMPKIKVKGQTVQTGERPQTNGRTHTHTDATKRIISPATRSIITTTMQAANTTDDWLDCSRQFSWLRARAGSENDTEI